MNTSSMNSITMASYADMMAMRFWLKLGSEIEARGKTIRGVSAEAGVNHTLVSEQIKDARNGRIPMDTRLEIIDRICRTLGRPLNYFLSE